MKTSVVALIFLSWIILAAVWIQDTAEAQTSTPAIETRRYISDTSVYVNESVTLRLRLRRLSGSAGHGGISVSFPGLDQSNSIRDNSSYNSPKARVTTASYTNGSHKVSYFPRDYDPIHQVDGSTDSADYLLVETDDTDWPENEYRTLELTITPKTTGRLRIYYRYWLCGDGYLNCIRDPDGNQVDQQGWSVGTYDVIVRNRRPSASKVSPLTQDVELRQGDTQTFTAGATDRDGNLSQVVWYFDDQWFAAESLGLTGSYTSSGTYTFPRVGTYPVRVEFTDTVGDSDSETWTVEVIPRTLDCFRDLGTLPTGTTTISGTWNGDCASTHQSGSYGRFYAFTLAERTRVQIDLRSAADAYLYLLRGADSAGSIVDEDDDGGSTGNNSLLDLTLETGTYTVEATTLRSGVTGNFSLDIDVDAPAPPAPLLLCIQTLPGVSPH